jgi:hypothetical protein
MPGLRRERELTVYISRNETEFQRVEAALRAQELRYRVWTTAEYPVFGWSPWDPRLLGRGEKRLRKVYHIEVKEADRQNLVAANMVIRSVTGKMFNAEPINEII